MTAIHPKTPPRLAREYKRAGSFHKLAEELRVNVGYVHNLIVHGKEPTDRTEKGRDTRAKLYLPRKRQKRAADCNHCGKRVEVAADGTLTSHSRPDGLYCKGSDTRDFLPPFKAPRQPQPEHLKWWSRLDKGIRAALIKQLHDLNKEIVK